MGFDEIVTKYSDPLPCDTCRNALEPIGKFSRTRNCFCKEYSGMNNMKPNGVLFGNEECSYYEPSGMKATDGGPGSGNFGHKGRPGLVGGSGPGGGKGSGAKYRGGRADIGYFGTRKDWLNGLMGEEQHKAVRFVANAKRRLNEAKEKKEKIEKYTEGGLFTDSEKEEMLENQGLKDIDGMTPEEYVISHGDSKEKRELLEHMSKARKWDQYKDQYLSENLSEEEKKVFDYVDFNFNRLGDKGHDEYFRLKAKAMGLNVDPNISEETLVASGVKEAIGKFEKFDWKGEGSGLKGWQLDVLFPRQIQNATGIPVSEQKKLESNEDIDNALQDMINRLAHKEMGSTSYDYMNTALESVATAKHIDWYGMLKKAFSGERIPNLTDEETKEIIDILKSGPKPFFGEIGDNPRSDEYDFIGDLDINKDNIEKARRYLLLKNKVLGAAEPESKEVVEEKERKKKEAAEQAKKEYFDKQDERIKSYPQSASAVEVSKKLKDSGAFMSGAPVDLYGCSRQNAAVAATMVERFIRRFPFMYKQLNGIDSKERGKDTYACSHRMSDDGRVSLNPSMKFFGSTNVESQYYDDVRSGFHPVGTTYEAVITHELAHSLGGWLSRRHVLGSRDAGSDAKQFEGLLRRRVLKALKMTKADVRQELSKYAEKDAYEWFAEAMAEAIHSPNPRPMAKECMRQLQEILKEEGLMDG